MVTPPLLIPGPTTELQYALTSESLPIAALSYTATLLAAAEAVPPSFWEPTWFNQASCSMASAIADTDIPPIRRAALGKKNKEEIAVCGQNMLHKQVQCMVVSKNEELSGQL